MVAEGFMKGIMLGFFAFAILMVAADNSDTTERIKLQMIQKISENKLNSIPAGLMIKTLDHLSPMIKLYDIPFTNKDIFMVNKFPLLGWTHVLVVIVAFWIFGWIIRVKATKIWVVLLISILILIGAYFVGSIIDKLVYHGTAEILGISKTDSDTLLNDFSGKMDSVKTPLLLFSIISLIFITKSFFGAIKNRKKR